MSSRTRSSYTMGRIAPAPRASNMKKAFAVVRERVAVRSRRQHAVYQRFLALGVGGAMMSLLIVYNEHRDFLLSWLKAMLLPFFA